MGFKQSEGLESGRALLPEQASALGPAVPGLWTAQTQVPGPSVTGKGLPLASVAQCRSGDVSGGSGTTRPQVHGPQVSIKHGAGQMPGPELRPPFQSPCPFQAGQPSANSSPALAAELGTCPEHFPSMLLVSLPFLFRPALSLTPYPALPFFLGWSRGPWGSQGTWAQASNGLLLGPFPPQSGQLYSPGKHSCPAGGWERALQVDSSTGGGSLPTAARSAPLL